MSALGSGFAHSRQLAKSNLILARLHELLDKPFPYHLHWTMAKAFNGVVLTDQRNVLQVLCFGPESTRNESGSVVVRLDDMVISGFRSRYMDREGELLPHASEFKEQILCAEADFNAMSDYERSIRLFQVARIHLRAHCDGNPDYASRECIDAMTRVGRLFESTVVLEPLHEDDWVSPAIDPEIATSLTSRVEREADILLADPIPEETVIQRLQTLMPTLDGPILGAGKAFGSAQASVLADSRIAFLDVVARHF